MRSRSPEPPDDALARRWEQLRAELARATDGAPPSDASSDVAGSAPASEPAPVQEDWWAGHTRLAPRRALPGLAGADLDAALDRAPGRSEESVDLGADDSEEPDPWRVPMPGRHASRPDDHERRDLIGWLRDRMQGVVGVQDALGRARGLLGPGPVAVVAVLVCLGLAWACWSMVRSRPVPVSAPISTGGAPPGAPLSPPESAGSDTPPRSPASMPTAAAGAAASPSAPVTVDVAGRVRRPGIAVLPAGSRVVDALKAAGGARGGVDLSSLNLARVLVDGEQILVGRAAPATAPGAAAAGGGAVPSAGAPLNLNTATAEQLEALPQVGPVTAQAIVAWRTEHGAFASVDELLEVDGIGDATLRQLAPLVTV